MISDYYGDIFMRFLQINTCLFFSSIVVLALTAPVAIAMERDEEPNDYLAGIRYVQAIKEEFLKLTNTGNHQEVLDRMQAFDEKLCSAYVHYVEARGEVLLELTNTENYQEALNIMSGLGLPEKMLDNLTPGGNLNHPYILNVIYSYLKSCNKLGEELKDRDSTGAYRYFGWAAVAGNKFWDFYKNLDEPSLNASLITILEEIIVSNYSLGSLMSHNATLAANNLRKMLEYDKSMIEKLQAELALKSDKKLYDKIGVKKYNYLIHIISYLPIVKSENKFKYYKKEMDEIILYLEKSKHERYPQAKEQWTHFAKPIIEKREKKRPTACLSQRSRARLQNKEHEAKAEGYKKHLEANEANLSPLNLIVCRLNEITEKVKVSDLDFMASKNREKYIQSQKQVAGKVIEVEEKIFEFVNPECEYEINEETLSNIYKRGSERLGISLSGRLIAENMFCFMNSGDYRNALLRILAYKRIMNGLPKQLEKFSVYLNFLLGNPADWVLYVEKQKEAKNKKRLAARKKITLAVKEDLKNKKREENEKSMTKRPHADFCDEKEEVKELPRKDAEQVYFYSPSVESTPSVDRYPEEKVKRKHWSEYPMVFVRNPGAPQKEEKGKGEEEEKEKLEFHISSTAYKAYVSLYSNSPHFTPGGAGTLLEAFGMQLEGGKGSHKKYSFANVLSGSRRILDKENKEVFRFPNLANASYPQGAMMVIPKWEENPPHYVIGAVRHILEKCGAKTTNVFKRNENEKQTEKKKR